MSLMKKQILLVDDNDDFSRLTASLLEYHHYKVVLAKKGSEAIDKARHRPDLVLLDRNLPDVDGLEICRHLREDKRLRSIPIIILSARDTAAEKIEGLYVGADDYITKPFDNEELLARIKAVLRRSQFSEQLQKDRIILINELKKILKQELITPFFQPIFSATTGTPVGFEMLSRPPQDSILNNPEFLFKAALNLGMYFDLEMLCWRKAISEWRKFGDIGDLFLNCSPYLIESTGFNKEIITKQHIQPKDLVLELTERLAIRDYAMFLEKLGDFRNVGINTAVDDVGCGYASLDMVAEIKPDYVKIDMSLIRNVQIDGLKQSIVEAIILCCKKSNIATIAEGIEKEEELEKVLGLGIDAVQGYLIGRPKAEINPDIKMSVSS